MIYRSYLIAHADGKLSASSIDEESPLTLIAAEVETLVCGIDHLWDASDDPEMRPPWISRWLLSRDLMIDLDQALSPESIFLTPAAVRRVRDMLARASAFNVGGLTKLESCG